MLISRFAMLLGIGIIYCGEVVAEIPDAVYEKLHRQLRPSEEDTWRTITVEDLLWLTPNRRRHNRRSPFSFGPWTDIRLAVRETTECSTVSRLLPIPKLFEC